MAYYIITSFVNFFTSIIIGIYLLVRGKNSAVQMLGYWSLCVGGWSLGYYFWQTAQSSAIALFWLKVLMAFAIVIPILILQFTISFLNLFSQKKLLIFVYYLISAIYLFTDFCTDFFISSVEPRMFFPYWPNPGIVFHPYLAMFLFAVVYSHYLLFIEFRKSSGLRRIQVQYVFWGTLIAFIGGSTNFPLWYGIPIPPVGQGLVIGYVVCIAYAILKYRLMDIKVVITRTGIFVAVYTPVLGIPFAIAIFGRSRLIEILGPGWWMAPLILMAILATVGPFIYIFLERRAEEVLLKEQRRYQQTLKHASVGMTRIRNLRKLLDLITHIVVKSVRISYVAVYLYDEQANAYVLQLSRDKGRIPVSSLAVDNSLISYLIHKRDPLIYEEVKRQMLDERNKTFSSLEQNMKLLTASVIIPSFLEDKLMGFFVLGDKISGQIYTVDDLNVFQVLASQAALAIENAKFYEETKELHEQISQAEKMATIGTMADGLSHQINNRFYALSLIASDTVDTIKLTDTASCTPEVKQMISDVNHALERIQSNVMQGGEVVRGMLKYTRRGEEGFEALELNKLLDNTLEMVQFKVRVSELDIIRDFNHIPPINGNMTQLEEAFFNFIDNANDAIAERKLLLKEQGYRGRITISAKQKTDDMLEIIVEDNGMGVKDPDVKKVFTPFFTTKISSRKGTGLGLYVIKRIITEIHNGKISFESVHKVGTRFIIELPIARG